MKRRLITSCKLLVIILFTMILPAQAQGSDTLLLSEIVVTPTEGEFVEIHNPTGSAIDLSDVYLTDATFAGGGTFYYNIVTGTNAGGGGFSDFHARFPDGASIAPGEYQTVALAGSEGYAATYGVDPTYELFEDGAVADAVPNMREALPGSINNQGGLSNSGEVVILYLWDGASDLVADLDYGLWGDKAEAVDKTGVAIDGPDADGTASAYLNDTPVGSQDVISPGSHSFGNSWQRDDLTEGAEISAGGNGISGHDETSEDVSKTWCENTPTPGAENECPVVDPGGEFGACGDGNETRIHTIQGPGSSSPEVNNVHVIEGVVVGDFQDTTTELSGFFVQEEDADVDGDPMTSEGIFVFDNGFGVDVDEGDVVRVQGTVIEFSDLTELSPVTNVEECADQVGGATAASVSLPVASVGDWEFVEGMAVTLNQELTASGNFSQGRFGEVDLSVNGRLDNPTNVAAPGGPAQAVLDLNNRSRIQLDDGSTVQTPLPLPPYLGVDNTLRAGDTIPNLTGVVSYFGNYEIHPTTEVNFSRVNARDLSPPQVNGTVTIAAFNVLNYFTTIDTGAAICGPNADQGCRGADTPEEFTRQRDKIISAISTLDADIVGLIELENNATDAPTMDLVSGLNAAVGTGTYDYIPTGAVGSDAIRVAFIYQPATVSPIGGFEILDSTDDPLFNDDKNRAALAQTFEEKGSGERFTVVVNHFKSKGSACDDVGDPDAGDGQGNCNGVRTDAAKALLNWLAGDPTGSNDPDYLITGDLNAYAQEDPITTIEAGGYTDLIEAFQGAGEYSFVFFGEAGYLDHGLSTPSLTPKVTGAAFWHINADEPSALDYNNFNQPALYNPDPYRSSDHDPVIVGLQANPRGKKLQAQDDLAALPSSGDRQTDKRVKRALKRIDKSLKSNLWVSDFSLDLQNGRRVFEEEKKAVRELMRITEDDGPVAGVAQAAINQLVEADWILAKIALNTAIANGGDAHKIAQAQAALDKAAEFVAAGKFDKAIERYRIAWGNAVKAL